MNLKTILTAALLFSMNSYASIECHLIEEQLNDETQTLVLVPQDEFSISIEGSRVILNKVHKVIYPKYVTNKTFPEAGVLIAYKGRPGRRSSVGSSLISMRFNSSQLFPVLGTDKVLIMGRLAILGRDQTNKSPETSRPSGAPIACDPEILSQF